jgi:hypothetical protein
MSLMQSPPRGCQSTAIIDSIQRHRAETSVGIARRYRHLCVIDQLGSATTVM